MDDMIVVNNPYASILRAPATFRQVTRVLLLPWQRWIGLVQKGAFSCTEKRIGDTLPQAFAL
jgi:hypothetical protein